MSYWMSQEMRAREAENRLRNALDDLKDSVRRERMLRRTLDDILLVDDMPDGESWEQAFREVIRIARAAREGDTVSTGRQP